MTFRGEIGSVVQTNKNAGSFSFEWSITDFLSLASEDGDRYQSPTFHCSGAAWCFKVYPKGLEQLVSGGGCDLFLIRSDEGAGKTFRATVGIRGAQGVVNEKEVRREFSSDNRTCCWIGFCPRKKLRTKLMAHALTITLNMRSDESRDDSTQTVDEDREDLEEDQLSEKKGIEKLVEDIGKLLSSGEDSDVIVQIGDVEFKAHRNILSVRCPVLSAMFRHDTAERASGKITIRDCEPDVFEDFLHYLYQGSARRLSEKNVFDLYRVADKYLVEDLKGQCLNHVRDTLSVETLCDAVELALTHAQKDLLEQATDFATKNIRAVVRSVEWQHFLRKFPTEANEILIKALG